MYCEKCGYPLGEGGKFCENCGTPVEAKPIVESEIQQPVAPVEEHAQPVIEQPEQPPVVQWQSESKYAQYTESVPVAEQGKSNTGLLVWAIITLVVSVCLCCSCLAIVSLVLSIIALVFVCQAPKQATLAERQSKEKTAKILLIISTACLGLSVIISIIFSLAGGYNTFIEGFEQGFNEGYYYFD